MQCTCTVEQLCNEVEVDIENRISAVHSQSIAGLQVGLFITSINGNLVTNRSELREELTKVQPNAAIAVGYGVTRESGDAQNPNRDEFDIDSDEDTVVQPPARPDTSVDNGVEEGTSDLNNAAVPDAPAEGQKKKNEIALADQTIRDAASRLPPGRCLLLLCDNCNPAFYVEAAASQLGTSVMHIDAYSRIKSKLRMEEYAGMLMRSLERGVWIYVENATKSISLLERLASCIEEASVMGKIHEKARVLLLCDPHPHFPAPLLENCITLRLRVNTMGVNQLEETMHLGASRLNVIQGQKPSTDVPTVNAPKEKKRVRIATDVQVVNIEQSAFLEMSSSMAPPTEANNEPGTLRRTAKYKFGPSEKLICLCRAGDNRFAVGTSSGYVVVLDINGLPMMQYRPHKSCIWDLGFSSLYDFATASEDGTSTIFHYDLPTQDLEAGSLASFQSDVFALAYAEPNNPSSAVLSGGLSATVCVLHSDRKTSSFIGAATSLQAMTTIKNKNQVLFGGGNGITAMIDPSTCQIVESVVKHTRKVPAVASCDNMVLSGSFDKSLRVWDVRNAMHCTHNLVMADVLTGVAIDGNYMAACSGASLFVWDVRNLREVVCSRQKAWNGLTRGLSINGDERVVVTASVDGAARFWSF